MPAGDLRLKRRNDVLILLLDADDAFARAHQLHRHLHAAQKGLGVMVQQFLVLVQQRLALGGVGNQEGHLCFELDRRGKPTAAGANDAKLVDTVEGEALERGRGWRSSKCPFLASYFGVTSKSAKICD